MMASLFLTLFLLATASCVLRKRNIGKLRIIAATKSSKLSDIQVHGLDLSDSLRRHVDDKVNKVLSHPVSRRVVNSHVWLKVDSSEVPIGALLSHERQTCEIVCSMKCGETIKATQSSDNMQKSIDIAAFILAQNLKMFSSRIRNHQKEKIAKMRDKNLGVALLYASYEGDLPRVKSLLALGANANYSSEEEGLLKGVFPLWAATITDKVEVIHALIAAGANVNQRKSAHSLVRIAALNNFPLALSVLMAAGADVNDNNSECSAVSISALDGHTVTLRLLLDAGANVNFQELLMAADSGHTVCVKLLLERGVTLQAEDLRRALMIAIGHGNFESEVVIRARLTHLELEEMKEEEEGENGKGEGESPPH